jgi:topoisomerase-4 subunit B
MDYTHKSFKVLNDLEAIRSSPGVYIGQKDDPTHLCEELIDNALDECLVGGVTSITVVYDYAVLFVVDRAHR